MKLDTPMPYRRLCACLVLSCGYMLVASVLVVIRLASARAGFELAPWQVDALWAALGVHVVGAVILAAAIPIAASAKRVTHGHARAALAAIPFMLLFSIDRLVSVEFPPPSPPTPTGMFQTHARRDWTNVPGWVDHRKGRETSINQLGFRGPDISIAKSEREQRIVFLGDSVAFGVGVDDAAVFVEQVGRLAGMDDCKRNVTVVNCSVTGYSPWQEYDLLETECLDFEPDLVVQVFCLNDVFQKYVFERFGGPCAGLAGRSPSPLEWSGLYRMVRDLSTEVNPLESPVSDNFHFFEALQRVERVYSFRRLIEAPDAPEIRAAWDLTLENMGKIHALVRDHGIPLAIVCFPCVEQISPDAPEPSSPQMRLAAFAEDAGIPFLDLVPMYRRHCRQEHVRNSTRRQWEGRSVFGDRWHPNKEGHRLAADAIYEFLTDQGLIGCGD